MLTRYSSNSDGAVRLLASSTNLADRVEKSGQNREHKAATRHRKRCSAMQGALTLKLSESRDSGRIVFQLPAFASPMPWNLCHDVETEATRQEVATNCLVRSRENLKKSDSNGFIIEICNKRDWRFHFKIDILKRDSMVLP